MPAPTAAPVRQAIVRRYQRGQHPGVIAQALGLPERTVRHLLYRIRHLGEAGLAPAYRHGDQPATQSAQQLRHQAVALRRQHPTWGAGLIRVVLGRRRRAELPTERTLQRWFRQAGLGPAPKGRRPTSPDTRASRPHDVWQIDAKELVRLGCGQFVSWLRIVDECSGAVLWTKVFPPGQMAESARGGRTGRTAPSFFPLGTTGHHPGRQWRSLGLGRRLAAGLGPVAAGAGHCDALE